jgi:hypothetical protein
MWEETLTALLEAGKTEMVPTSECFNHPIQNLNTGTNVGVQGDPERLAGHFFYLHNSHDKSLLIS